MQIQTPDWVKHAVFYQIFPDSFARSRQSRPWLAKPTKLEAWDAPPTFQGYKGGDLWGIVEKLDYLQDLGINALYLTPIFQSASNHRYHTHDYYQVDPMLGGNEALQDLLEAAHQREMKVVLDGVFNHASRGFFFFNDILENGSNSPWLDWFKIKKWPLAPYNGDLPANYDSWADYRALPEFNHENPGSREYIMRVAEHWIQQGIDGWRLDVADCIKVPGFWQEFRDRVKALNPDAYIVGEVWRDAGQWLDGSQFDGVMNYEFGGPTIAFTAGDRVDLNCIQGHDYDPSPALDAPSYAKRMERLLGLYADEIQQTQLNLLESHDTSRMLTLASGDAESVELATLLMLTFPGAPNIYYGTEVGLPGGLDPDCRRGFPSSDRWDRRVLDYHRQLIALRHSHPALRTGDYRILFADELLYAFARVLGDEEIVVAVNAGPMESAVDLRLEEQGLRSQPRQVLYGDGTATWKEGHLVLHIPARSGLVVA